LRKEAFAGRDDVVAKLPALSLAPMIGLYFAAFGADKMAFTEQFIEYEFSPVSLKVVKPQSLYEEFLKALDTEFAPQEEGENPSAIQIILDENLINGFIGQFLKVDKMYSLRDFLSHDPRMAVVKQLMTSTTIGMAIPSFKEQYGENRPVDVVLTASHEYMTDGIGEVPPTGISIDEKGNF